tara:strand:+ start:6421 stop:7215 length:795 start_codon:yes stop_codon:yes gene_type:complete
MKKLISITKPFRYYLDSKLYGSRQRDDIKSLKDIHKGKTIIIIGNGPSLKRTPLDNFKDYICIGMNKIDLIFPKVKWRPQYVIAENNLVVKQHWRKMNNINIKYVLSWKSRWFIAKKQRNNFFYYFNNSSNEFSIDAENGFGSSSTVTYSALQLAYYMGAKTVILLGIDHNFATKGKPLTYERRSGPDNNHFDPNYFPSGSFWGVPDLKGSEIGYSLAKKTFENDGRKIYDATLNGKLDVFEKISIDEALNIGASQSGEDNEDN